MDYSLPGSSLHEIFHARILECVAISYSSESFWSGIEHTSLESPALVGRFFITGLFQLYRDAFIL